MIYDQFTPTNITTNTTTIVKTGSGLLHSVTINTKGSSSNTIKLYDGLTAGGTLFATIDSTANVGFLLFNAQFSQGLTVVTGTGSAGDITINFR